MNSVELFEAKSQVVIVFFSSLYVHVRDLKPNWNHFGVHVKVRPDERENTYTICCNLLAPFCAERESSGLDEESRSERLIRHWSFVATLFTARFRSRSTQHIARCVVLCVLLLFYLCQHKKNASLTLVQSFTQNSRRALVCSNELWDAIVSAEIPPARKMTVYSRSTKTCECCVCALAWLVARQKRLKLVLSSKSSTHSFVRLLIWQMAMSRSNCEKESFSLRCTEMSTKRERNKIGGNTRLTYSGTLCRRFYELFRLLTDGLRIVMVISAILERASKWSPQQSNHWNRKYARLCDAKKKSSSSRLEFRIYTRWIHFFYFVS